MAQLCRPLSLVPSREPGVKPPRAGSLLSCPGELYPTEASPSSWIPSLPYTWLSPLCRNILKMSSPEPEREIALEDSSFWLSGRFRGLMKTGLSSSELWRDLSKRECADPQAQSCCKTFLGEPRLCCKSWRLGQSRGIH